MISNRLGFICNIQLGFCAVHKLSIKELDTNKVIEAFKEQQSQYNFNVDQDMRIATTLIKSTADIIGTENIETIRDYLLGDPEGEDVLSEQEDDDSDVSDDDSDGVSIEDMNEFVDACNKLGLTSNFGTVFTVQQAAEEAVNVEQVTKTEQSEN